MPNIEVYQDEEKAKLVDRGVPSWTFSVDGQASGYWCPSEYAARRVIGRLEQGKSREAFGSGVVVSQPPSGSQANGTSQIESIEQVIKTQLDAKGVAPDQQQRILSVLRATTQQGRGKVYQRPGEAQQDVVIMPSGRQKAKEKPRMWKYELDGKECEEEYASEKEAKVACAWKAFMTRGKLGRLKEVEEEFEKEHGKKAKVHYDGKSVIAEDEEGKQYAVGVGVGSPIRFKPLENGQSPDDALHKD